MTNQAERDHNYYTDHREEILERKRKYRAENTDYMRQYRSTRYAELRNQVLKREGYAGDGWSTQEEKELFALYGDTCAYCGKPLGDSFDHTIDHILSLENGGLHELSNVVPCCRKCNTSKANKLLEQWLKAKGYIFPRVEQPKLFPKRSARYMTYRATYA
jgi:5-methylcytosine-specific restriction endonuclease McrA